MSARLTNNKLFVLLALAAAALVAWGAANAAFLGATSPAAPLPGFSPANHGNFGIQGFVSYVVYDSRGNVVAESSKPNAINDNVALEAIFNYVTGASGYPNIAAASNTTADILNGPDDVADTAFTDNVGGNIKAGTPGGWNSGTNSGTVQATFTNDGGGTATIRRILLTSADTGQATDILNDQIFAFQDVTVDLNNDGDNVQFTWTITITEAP